MASGWRISPGTRLTALYLLVQGLSGGVWWLVLALSPSMRERFQPPGFGPGFILTYAWADLTLFVGGSFIAAWLIYRRHPAGRAAIWLTAGATLFATLHCLGVSWQSDGFWLATWLMMPPSLLTIVLALTLGSEMHELPRVPFQTTRPTSTLGVVMRSSAQIIVFWGFFLGVIPALIVALERGLGIPPVLFQWQRWIGAAVFILGGATGLWSAWMMARIGRGTPLPTSCPSVLVLRGPYRFVRNPMAVGGILQGAGVAIALGSIVTVLYAILGGVIWHACVRPAEESDLVDRFGNDYLEYRRRVRCWIPRLRGEQATS